MSTRALFGLLAICARNIAMFATRIASCASFCHAPASQSGNMSTTSASGVPKCGEDSVIIVVARSAPFSSMSAASASTPPLLCATMTTFLTS